MHFWWPKISGRMYPEGWGRLAALIVFIGFNLTFFPQFILGYMGMPRRYWHYSQPEFQVLNVLSTAGATILAVGYLLPMMYFLWSMRYGKPAPDNPVERSWPRVEDSLSATTFNFDEQPVVTWEAYNYDEITAQEEVPVAHSPVARPTTRPMRTRPSCIISRRRSSRRMPPASACGCSWSPRSCSSAACSAPTWCTGIWYFGDFAAASHSLAIKWGAVNTAVLICSAA